MGMFDPGMMPPGGGNGQQQQPQNQHMQNPMHQNHFNSNMSNNLDQKHNPVGSWQRGGWDSGIQSGATSQTPSVLSGNLQRLFLSFLMKNFFDFSDIGLPN